MKLVSSLERESDWERQGGVFVPVERNPHRPRKRFRLFLRSVEDARLARQSGFPLIIVQSADLKILQYPMKIPPTVIVPREYRDTVVTSLNLLTFQSTAPFEKNRVEDVIVFLLMHDPIAARAVVERNREFVDLQYLRKRLFQEDLEEQASLVRLQDFVDLPVVGKQLARESLERAVAGNKVSGVVP